VFSGQSFMADQMSKIATIRAQYPQLEIQVDGGVSIANIEQCAKAGANSFVAGMFCLL
jgi:pentose-5-phosphate-3-epimerase